MPSAIGTADHVGNQLIWGTPWDGRPHLEGLAIDASWSPNGLVDQSRKGASCRKRAQILTSAGFTLYSGSFVTEDPRQTVDEALGLSMFHVGANNLGVVVGGWSTRAVRGNISKSFQAFHAFGGPDGMPPDREKCRQLDLPVRISIAVFVVDKPSIARNCVAILKPRVSRAAKIPIPWAASGGRWPAKMRLIA